MKIGVTGATGHLGRIIVEKLKELMTRENIAALVRSPEKASGLGVEVREFNYDKPETLAAALDRIETLMFISASEIGQRARQHENVINAAKKAGVKWIIYTSILHADTSSINLAEEHFATEKELQKSGIPHTILRNGWYFENYTGSVQSALAGGALAGCAGDGKISAAVRADFAEAAVAVLTGKDQKGKIYELAGDESFTMSDLAAEISRQSGRNISYRNMSEKEYADLLKSFGIPGNMADSIASWDVSASKGALYDSSHQLSKLIGHPTTGMAQAVAEALKVKQEA